MNNEYYTYILSNKNQTVLYVGYTNNLIRRIREHKFELSEFTAKYNCSNLVYFELYNTRELAFSRETQIKKWSRSKKVKLIESKNVDWLILNEIIGKPILKESEQNFLFSFL